MSDLRGALMSIYQRDGQLTPEAVVDEARPPGSELHNRFEWNDSVAAECFRHEQARELIRSVRIRFDDKRTGERKYVRAFSSVRDAGKTDRSGYAPTEEIARDEFAVKLLLSECKREIADLKRKYGHLEDFTALVRAEIENIAS